MSAATVKSMCPMNCHPTYCGMEIRVDGERVLGVRGDAENPDSHGFLCIRGRAAPEIIHNEQRLKAPLRRVGPRGEPRWEVLGWDEALDALAGRMLAAGRERVAFWTGHGVGVNTIGRELVGRLTNTWGCQQWIPSIICWSLGGLGLALTGALEANTKEDMGEHSNTILMWGANLASQPNTTRHLVAARRRGAQVIAIDCRRTETANHADRFFMIRPGTDAALALAMMHVIVSEGLVDEAFVAQHTVGFPQLCEAVRERTPEWAEGVTGMAAADVREVARLYARNQPSMIVVGGASMYKHANGWQASRAISCLPALTGSYGRPGGGLGPRHRASTHGRGLGSLQSPEARPPGAYLESHMGAMLRDLEAGKIDVLFLAGTNMLSSFADANRLERALQRVGLIAAFDIFPNDTIRRVADLVLPGTSWAEEVGLKATFTHVYLMDRAIPPQWACRPLPSVVLGLAQRLGVAHAFPWASQEDAVEALLATLGEGAPTLEQLRANGGQWPLAISHVAYPDRRFDTPSGKIELYSPRALEHGLPPLPTYDPPLELPESDPARARRYPLVFKQARSFTHFHSFYDSGRVVPTLARADQAPTLWINPADAAARGITHGDAVRLGNDRGEMAAVARVTDDAPAGVVWMHDGWQGVNRLTSSADSIPERANWVAGFPAGQAAFEALVEVVRAAEERSPAVAAV